MRPKPPLPSPFQPLRPRYRYHPGGHGLLEIPAEALAPAFFTPL